MTNVTEEVKLSLKVMVNKDNNKVLFAEAGSDFADVLLSFLTLPLGKIFRLVDNHYGDETPVKGKLTNLYKFLSELDKGRFLTEGAEELLLQIISRYHDTLKCHCGEYMNNTIEEAGAVFMKKGLSFLITDDLKMVPILPDSIVQTLINLGVTITEGAQLRIVSLGLNEIMDLLRASLLSTTPLTDVVIHNKINKIDGVTWDLLHTKKKKESSTTPLPGNVFNIKIDRIDDDIKRMKENFIHSLFGFNRTLYVVENSDSFVDFLYGLLVIPLSGVECLLGGKTCLRIIDNLYRSVQDHIDENCFRKSDMRSGLVKPKLPPGCLLKNPMFTIEEEVNFSVCFFQSVATTGHSNSTNKSSSWMHFKDLKGYDIKKK